MINKKNIYIGTSVVRATPMNRLEYCTMRTWDVLLEENQHEKGYLVEYINNPNNPNLEGYDCYVSWVLKNTFEEAYEESSNLSFGLALEASRSNLKIARLKWDNPSVYVYLSKNGEVFCHFDMTGYNGNLTMGWLPSAEDILAKDWYILNLNQNN
jgi:hypothetical protein